MNLNQELQKYLQLPDDEFISTLHMLREKGFMEDDDSLQQLVRLFEEAFGNGIKHVYKEMTENILSLDEENDYENHNESE